MTIAPDTSGPASPPQVRTRRSRWRRFFIVVLALFLIALLVRTGVDLWAGHRVRVAVEKLEQQHGSLGVTTLNVALVPAADNRARAMRAAQALTVGRYERQNVLTRALQQPTNQPSASEVQAFIETNRDALRVANDARSRTLSNWEADYTAGQNIPGLLEIRYLSDVIYLAGRVELDAGRADAAAAHFATGLALSSSLRQEPSLITQLIRCALGFRHFEGVQRLLTQSEPSSASLQELARWLAEERTPEPMHIGLLGELKIFNAALAFTEQGRPPGYLTGMSVAAPPYWVGPVSRISRPLIRLARARYLEQVGHLLEIQMGPRPRPISTVTPPTWSFLPRFEMGAITGLQRSMESGDTFASTRGMTELAVALRRFRIDRGQYPDTLPALMPAYVASVPIDPLTGAPPEYAREGAGFRLKARKHENFTGTTAAVLEWSVPK